MISAWIRALQKLTKRPIFLKLENWSFENVSFSLPINLFIPVNEPTKNIH